MRFRLTSPPHSTGRGGVRCYSCNSVYGDSRCADDDYRPHHHHVKECAKGVTGCFTGNGTLDGERFGEAVNNPHINVASHTLDRDFFASKIFTFFGKGQNQKIYDGRSFNDYSLKVMNFSKIYFIRNTLH